MTLNDLKRLSAQEKALITTIDLTNFNLSRFPSELFDLPNLQTLFLSQNRIPEIPGEISRLENLYHLNLSDNSIAEIPTELGQLKKLTSLYLSNNQLTEFPTQLGSTNLQTLSLSSNRIKFLPENITGFKKLKNLFLENTEVERLPKQFAFLPQIKTIELKGCNLASPPIEIVHQGVPALRNYFTSIDEAQETFKVFEAKLLIVGEGNVGKTCLKERLIDSSADLRNISASTEGIDIDRWFVKTKKCSDFRINIWDFGGQEIYHSTHQFFLTKRSLYVFVWTARTDDNIISFDYWLNVIKLLSDNAPVLVVLNKIDERIKMIDEHSIKSKFNNIADFLKVSALKGNGMDSLVDSIKREMEKLPHIGDTLPKSWVEIRNKLENLGENYISLSEYKKICQHYKLNSQQALHLSRYFHDLGVILHFQDNEILNEIVFLKPEWATNAVYKVADTKKIQLSYGKFKFSDLGKIWSTYEKENYRYLIELMKKFELCFKIKENEYIVPELLSEVKPEAFYKWKNDDNLIFEYHYDFMPTGIITRLIVRVHDIISDSNYWKNGLIVKQVEPIKNAKGKITKYDQTEAMIISIPLERKIRLSIRGSEKAQLLGIIRREIDIIHKSLNYPDFKEMIPCKCPTCSKSSEINLYNYRDLKVYLESNEPSIFCTYGKTKVNIKNLLIDISPITPNSKNIQKVNINKSKVIITDKYEN
jgi:internalin A